jgi:hypothetical protein
MEDAGLLIIPQIPKHSSNKCYMTEEDEEFIQTIT